MNTLFQLPSTKLSTNGRIRKRPRLRSALRKEELKAYNNVLKDMGSALKSAGAEANHLHKKIKSFQQKFKNFQKQNKRKENNLAFQKKMVIQLKAERKKMIKNMEKESKSDKKANHKIKCQMKAYKKSAARSKAKYKSIFRRLKSKMIGSLEHNEDSDNLTSDAAEVSNSNIYELEVKVDELREQIQQLQSKKLEVMEKGHFNHRIRECCMTMLAQNVGIRNVEKWIRAALELCNIKVDHLPTKSTLANMAVEARSIAHLQLGE